MGRPREFDEQQVVTRACELFWRRGYHATSVRDLGDELALNPSSLYRAFGDKHELFLRALDHYLATESARAQEKLDAQRPARQVLADWLHEMVDQLCADPAARGCFMVNTAIELAANDPATAERVHAAFRGLRGAITKVLERGRDEGDLRPDLDTPAASEHLLATVLGQRVLGRAGLDPSSQHTAIDFVMTALGDRDPPNC